ncbi:hypothetical protein PVAP13_2KG465405 [Panicum virgatum]|uniref:Uncharacterized protein n=1 Tax=Panicum virgatum TaxID=38727 RepID=A0A8T0WF08_PANVG|nr:hypothetical protein PVAP13_2KG465405 [Panicum virgatum]
MACGPVDSSVSSISSKNAAVSCAVWRDSRASLRVPRVRQGARSSVEWRRIDRVGKLLDRSFSFGAPYSRSATPRAALGCCWHYAVVPTLRRRAGRCRAGTPAPHARPPRWPSRNAVRGAGPERRPRHRTRTREAAPERRRGRPGSRRARAENLADIRGRSREDRCGARMSRARPERGARGGWPPGGRRSVDARSRGRRMGGGHCSF